MERTVQQRVEQLLAERGTIRSGELAQALSISRQAAHRHLRRGVEEGRWVPEGRGRSVRYRAVTPVFSYRIAGSAEDRILADVEARTPALASLSELERRALDYAASEMINNALDHSGGTRVTVRIALATERIVLEVEDDGIGALERVRSARGLASHVEAAAELTKGKVTTMPERHSGEGIFFTSKIGDRFELHANGHVLLVDAARDDVAVLAEPSSTSPGTRVVVVLARPFERRLADVFAEWTEDYEFVRTRTVVRLFGLGLAFVSRSEARRLLQGLERFRHVVLDFEGVPGIGQGFADEIFRVFARAHPEIALDPIHMNEDTRFFVERARRAP